MGPIKSFAEAKKRLGELDRISTDLRAFLDFADDAIAKVNTLKGGDGITLTQPINAPSTWGERVIEIFRQAESRPMMQKEVMERYELTGWPRPADRSELYRAISGAVAYLHKKKEILIKTEDGYKMKQ